MTEQGEGSPGPAASESARLRQQAAVARLGQRALAGLELGAVLEEAASAVARELGTELVSVLELLADGDSLRLRAGHGWPEGYVGKLIVPASRGSLAGYTLTRGGIVISEDLTRERRFAASPVHQRLGVVSALAVVLPGRERPFGVMGAHSTRPHHFGLDDAHFVQAVANTVGAAAERARAEALVRDSEARIRELADTAPALIWTTDAEGRITFVNERWRRFTGRSLEEELGDTWGLSAHPDDRAELTRRWLEVLTRREEFRMEYRLRRADGQYRWVLEVGVPRFSDGSFAGYVGTSTDIHERKSMEERLRKIYEHEHRIAETLQRSLLPQRLPEIEGLELAARYLPAAKGAEIGGDWYDAMELPDGRVALVVGDVVGHGLRAAAAMGQLRNAFRAYALTESSPAEIVGRLNRLLLSGGDEGMATVLCLVLDRDSGQLTFANAGHPPPLVLDPTGARFVEGGRSVPVGAAAGATFTEESATVAPGSTILLYTDGLIERRDTPLERSLDQLREVAEAARPREEAGEDGLERLCEAILSGVLRSREPLDDVALLAVRPLPVGAEGLRLRLPADPEALAGLRRRVGRLLSAVGASPAETYEITLAICEAAGNAIEHAYGPEGAPFEVSVWQVDGDLIASVRDFGRWRKRRERQRGRGLAIIRGVMDAVDVGTEGQGTVVRMRRRLGSAA
jgi:PAS domain S-box-containing protein